MYLQQQQVPSSGVLQGSRSSHVPLTCNGSSGIILPLCIWMAARDGVHKGGGSDSQSQEFFDSRGGKIGSCDPFCYQVAIRTIPYRWQHQKLLFCCRGRALEIEAGAGAILYSFPFFWPLQGSHSVVQRGGASPQLLLKYSLSSCRMCISSSPTPC